MPFENIEVYSYEGEVWCRTESGKNFRLTESDTEIIDQIEEQISTFYTEAYKALCEEYGKCSLNVPYWRYRKVMRFLKCNFGIMDNSYDICGGKLANFEYVPCPLRGECKWEKIICQPKFTSNLSPAEERVMRLWVEGYGEPEIAEQLCLSQYTIHNHIRNAYARVGVKSKSEFTKYAIEKGLFK